jgi:hypothetical protein
MERGVNLEREGPLNRREGRCYDAPRALGTRLAIESVPPERHAAFSAVDFLSRTHQAHEARPGQSVENLQEELGLGTASLQQLLARLLIPSALGLVEHDDVLGRGAGTFCRVLLQVAKQSLKRALYSTASATAIRASTRVRDQGASQHLNERPVAR